MAKGLFAGGDGSPENPYLIEDTFDFDAIRNGLDKHYKIVNNLDFEGITWSKISNFAGELDGNFKMISGLYFSSDSLYRGLFHSPKNAVFRNLKFSNIINDNTYNGGSGLLISRMNKGDSATVLDCQISLKVVNLGQYFGAVVGCHDEANKLTIENVSVDITVNTDGKIKQGNVGGLIGGLSSSQGKVSIRNCCVRGNFNCPNIGYIGGLIGAKWYGTEAVIENCYFSGTIVGLNGINGIIGSLAGNGEQKNLKVQNTFWNSDLVANGGSYGGTGLTTQEMQTAQTFIDAGWDKELNDDGKPIWILKDEEYPKLWFEADEFYLFKKDNTIYSYEGGFVVTGLAEPLTVEDFKQSGIEDLSLIDKDDIKSFGSFELLAWTDANTALDVVTVFTEPIKPYQLLNNPYIVTYTEDEEVPMLSQVVEMLSKVRFLVSKDGYRYQVYRGGEWELVDKSKIILSGMTKEELESIPQEEWATWVNKEAYKGPFEILVGMYSDEPNLPLIRSVRVDYTENESPLIISAEIVPDTIHNEFATLNAHVKDYEGDKLSFKTLIKKADSEEFVQVSPLNGWYNRNSAEIDITQAYNFPYFTQGENQLKLVAKDERGLETEWVGNVILTNTDPLISLTYDDFGFRAAIGDDDNDAVAYRISINGELIHDYTKFIPTKAYINYIYDTDKMRFGEENIVTLEVIDTHGGYAREDITVVGTYRGLMFKNELGDYLVDPTGNVLLDLLFNKTLISGQTSETKKVTLENRYEFPIDNVVIKIEKSDFAEGANVEISEVEMPFTPKDIIKLSEILPSTSEKDFYLRVVTDRTAYHGGYFYINSTATPLNE